MLRVRKRDEHVTDVWPYTRRGKNWCAFSYCRQTLDSVNFNNSIRLVVSLIIHLLFASLALSELECVEIVIVRFCLFTMSAT